MNEEVALIWPVLKESGLAYPPQAYGLVQKGLRRSVQSIYDSEDSRLQGARHVTGQELCLGIRDEAIEQYGPLARTVLSSWGVQCTEDFGRMVYAMVDAGLLRMNDADSPEDFVCVYDFDEAFASVLDVIA